MELYVLGLSRPPGSQEELCLGNSVLIGKCCVCQVRGGLLEVDRAVACCSLTIAAAGADWNEDERLTGCVPAGKGIGSHLCVS